MDKKIINNIITKLSEGEKVELNAIDDLRNTIESLQGITRNLQGDLQTYVSLQKRVENEITDGDTRLKQSKSYMQEIKKGAKELGIDVNSLHIVKAAKTSINKYESISKSKRGFGSKFK
jgi:hypothetical protein